MNEKQTKILTGQAAVYKSLKPLDLSTCSKTDILEYFNNTYDVYETLFTTLNDDNVFYLCPDRLRLPLVFYFAHTAVVYVNKLMLAGLLKERINIEFETMFETGVDEMSWDDTENYRMGGSYKWPSIASVVEYRTIVREIITRIIEETPLQLPITADSPWWALVMGFEHERIHIETSSVLIRQLPVDMVTKPEGWIYGPAKHGQGFKNNPMIKMDATDVMIGKPENFPSFGWDNEYGVFNAHVPEFEASKFMITNREYLEFVKDGGYNNRNLWTDRGLEWKEYKQANHPAFWVCTKGCRSGCGADLANYSHCEALNNNYYFINTKIESNQFRYRAMFDNLELPMDWPVECNYHEAKAFCAWRGVGYRLPGEAEHNVMRGYQKSPSEGISSDIIYQDPIPANLNMEYGSSTPVNMYPANDAGFCDVFGNVWEWTEDQFNGLDGFQTHYLYDDFSYPGFDGKHQMILGGSWVSTGDEASRFARYAFRPHFVQHAGFRIVRNVGLNENLDLPIRVVKDDVYILGSGEAKNVVDLDESKVNLLYVPSANYHYTIDTDTSLYGILQLEFGYRENLPDVVSEYSLMMINKYNSGSANCAVFGSGGGKLAFLLRRFFDQVLGVDICARFINAAITLQESHRYNLTTSEGSQNIQLDCDMKTDNIIFKQLTWIPNEIVAHDLVLLTHLHRLQNPEAWLLRLWEIVKSTGIVVIISVDKQWKKDDLLPYLSNRLACIESDEIRYVTRTGQQTATVTVWKHHWAPRPH